MLLVVAIQLIIQMHIELWCRRLNLHFIFPKVVQAHTLGEVGNCDTVLLRVYSGTILAIFIEVGSYLTDKEQKNKLAQFFETRCSILWPWVTSWTHCVKPYSLSRKVVLSLLKSPVTITVQVSVLLVSGHNTIDR